MARTNSKSAAGTGNDKRVREMILWARKERIVLSMLQIGDIELHIAADLSLVVPPPSLANVKPNQDQYELFGGQALERLRQQEASEHAEVDVTVEEDD